MNGERSSVAGQVAKTGQVGEAGKVGTPGEVESAGNEGKVGNVGKVGKIGKADRVGQPLAFGLMTAANGVTVARIAATPVLVLVVLDGVPSWAALVLWTVLASSDAADGWVARRRGKSASGAFLDPLADKFLVLGAMAAIAALGKFTWAPIGLLAAREALITAYRVVVARQGVSVPARRAAKVKTLVEFLTVGLVLVPVAGASEGTLSQAARVALWFAVALAWASAAQYLFDSRSAGRRAFAGNA